MVDGHSVVTTSPASQERVRGMLAIQTATARAFSDGDWDELDRTIDAAVDRALSDAAASGPTNGGGGNGDPAPGGGEDPRATDRDG